MCAPYLFDADFCNVASGWEKGVVEKELQDSRRRIWLDALPQPRSIRAMAAVHLAAGGAFPSSMTSAKQAMASVVYCRASVVTVGPTGRPASSSTDPG
jgi:hypothetical protein